MKSSLVELVADLQLKQLEKWFDEFLSEEDLINRLDQDSWELREAVWCLWAKKPYSGVKDQFDCQEFLLDSKILAVTRATGASSDKESDTILILYAGITRLSKVYDTATRSILAPKTKENKNALRAKNDTVNGNTRYHVKPREFLTWVYRRKLLMLPKVKKFIERHVLEKKRGRRKDPLKDDLLRKLVEISNYDDCKGKLYAPEILLHPEIKETIEKKYKVTIKDPKTEKLKHLAKELKRTPGFGGKCKGNN